jgi:hypothetical protein
MTEHVRSAEFVNPPPDALECIGLDIGELQRYIDTTCARGGIAAYETPMWLQAILTDLYDKLDSALYLGAPCVVAIPGPDNTIIHLMGRYEGLEHLPPYDNDTIGRQLVHIVRGYRHRPDTQQFVNDPDSTVALPAVGSRLDIIGAPQDSTEQLPGRWVRQRLDKLATDYRDFDAEMMIAFDALYNATFTGDSSLRNTEATRNLIERAAHLATMSSREDSLYIVRTTSYRDSPDTNGVNPLMAFADPILLDGTVLGVVALPETIGTEQASPSSSLHLVVDTTSDGTVRIPLAAIDIIEPLRLPRVSRHHLNKYVPKGLELTMPNHRPAVDAGFDDALRDTFRYTSSSSELSRHLSGLRELYGKCPQYKRAVSCALSWQQYSGQPPHDIEMFEQGVLLGLESANKVLARTSYSPAQRLLMFQLDSYGALIYEMFCQQLSGSERRSPTHTQKIIADKAALGVYDAMLDDNMAGIFDIGNKVTEALCDSAATAGNRYSLSRGILDTFLTMSFIIHQKTNIDALSDASPFRPPGSTPFGR